MSDIREGYKITELGEIPNEWEVRQLKEISVKVTIGLVTTMTKHYVDNGIPLIRNSDIKDAKIRTEKMINLSYSFAEQHSAKKMKKNDIVTVHTGDIGTSSLISEKLEGCLGFATLQTTVDEEIYNPEWLMRYFNSDIAKIQFYNFSTGDGRNNLNLKDFVKTKVIVPKLVSEQKKIASILSTVDEQIYETEQLIVKTKELKKGLMQQLLTKGIGHTEFKQTELGEIPIGWEVKHLSDVLTVCYGKNQKDVEVPKSEIPILGTGGIIGWSNKALYDRPSVLIGRKGTIDKPRYIDTPFWTIDTLFYTDIDNKLTTPKFIYYLFQTIDWYKYNEATGVPSLSASNISKITFASPILEEQQKIASILSTVDEQIEVYEQEQVKYKELKKGLMQQLLTGQIRVKI